MLGGERQTVVLGDLAVEYELLPRMYVQVAARLETVDGAGEDISVLEPYAGLRWGLPFGSIRY